MPDFHDIISKTLDDAGVVLAADIFMDTEGENNCYAFIEISRDSEGKQVPTNYALRRIAEKLKGRGISITFVHVESEQEDIQGTLKNALFRFFPEDVRNAFFSSAGNGITVWVEPKRLLEPNVQSSICEKIADILQTLDIRLEAVRFTTNENLPTVSACLRFIKIKSPVCQQELHAELVNKGFDIPSPVWLSRVLDKLRKSGSVIRQQDENFVLTLDGLLRLGSSKHRSSHDIVRALDIARRGN